MAERFGITVEEAGPEDLTPRYNVAPSQTVPITIASEKGRRLVMAKWDFRPAWMNKDSKLARINARSETVATSRLFATAVLAAGAPVLDGSGFFAPRRKGDGVVKTLALVLAVLFRLATPTNASAESWILWESVKEGRLHPVDSPFSSQAACVSRGQARITQYTKQLKPPRDGAVIEAIDGGLTAQVRWQDTSDPSRQRKTLEPILAMYERELERQTELAAAQRELYERGALSESELREGRRALIAAQKEVEDMRRAIAQADKLSAETKVARPTTKWVGVTPLRYQCWPVGVNPQ